MNTRHLLGAWPDHAPRSRTGRILVRPPSDVLAHLFVMDTNTHRADPFEPVLSISELASQLHVTAQTIYDLRSRGRGPRGFRVGREIRFRRSLGDAGNELADGFCGVLRRVELRFQRRLGLAVFCAVVVAVSAACCKADSKHNG